VFDFKIIFATGQTGDNGLDKTNIIVSFEPSNIRGLRMIFLFLG
jgi:hypothetical protein